MKKIIAIILSVIISLSFTAVYASAQDAAANAQSSIVLYEDNDETADSVEIPWYDVTLGTAVNKIISIVRTVVEYICSVINLEIPAL